MRKVVILLTALCLVAGMSGPAWALHPILEIELFAEWGDIDAFDIEANVKLLDINGDVVPGWGADLQPDPTWTNWTKTYVNIPDAVVINPGTL